MCFRELLSPGGTSIGDAYGLLQRMRAGCCWVSLLQQGFRSSQLVGLTSGADLPNAIVLGGGKVLERKSSARVFDFVTTAWRDGKSNRVKEAFCVEPFECLRVSFYV